MFENHLKANKTKYLCGDHPTLADFAMGAHLIRLAYNHKYENEHIIKAVIANYPLAQAWIENFYEYVAEWWTKEGNNWDVNY